MAIPYLLYISFASIVISIVGRKQEIGGWLFYFYYWILAILYVSVRDFALHVKVYKPSFGSGTVNHEALVLATFPRFFVYLAVATIAGVLLFRREWVWVERLRTALLAGVIIAGFSVWLDVRYFPKSTFSNRWQIDWPLFLAGIFFVSKRVHHVFRTDDWDDFVGQITTDS